MSSGQLTYSSGADAFTFQRSAIQRFSENNDRDLFTIEIPFVRDPFAQDFVDTNCTISISGKLTNASSASDSTAYNATDGGGCLGQLVQLRTIAGTTTDDAQSTFYLTISGYGGLLSNIPVLVQQLNYEVFETEPGGAITYSLQLRRVQP